MRPHAPRALVTGKRDVGSDAPTEVLFLRCFHYEGLNVLLRYSSGAIPVIFRNCRLKCSTVW